jgi:hypothetical protein
VRIGLYSQLVEAEGALPRPTLLRSGEAKIGSRLVPRSAELMYVNQIIFNLNYFSYFFV